MYLQRDWVTSAEVRYLRADSTSTGYSAHRLEGGGWRLGLPDGTEQLGRHETLDDVEREIANLILNAT